MGKPISEKEQELVNKVIEYAKRKGLSGEDAVAIVLPCRGDDKAELMLKFLNENPDIDFTLLLEKAVEIYKSDIE